MVILKAIHYTHHVTQKVGYIARHQENTTSNTNQYVTELLSEFRKLKLMKPHRSYTSFVLNTVMNTLFYFKYF